MSTTTLHLAKQNFKFSAAHFLIFDDKHAERLHGHNYQVRVDIKTPNEEEAHAGGYFVDFNVFKKYIKAKLDQWDEIVLLPEQNPDMKFGRTEKGLEVMFRDRFYAFPANEVILLPVTNTSVEQLSRLLAEDFIKEFKKYGVSKVRVYVEETRGQGASTTAP
jgi:6-pyruvoyltetrahydropterin/6-carboxytetrahydropterin synthase